MLINNNMRIMKKTHEVDLDCGRKRARSHTILRSRKNTTIVYKLDL